MHNQHTKSKIILSIFWKLVERGGTQGIQFIVQIFLARLLLPEEYGIIAIVNVFILLANVFVQSGLNTALIQKREADEVDFSSVFYLSLLIAGILYVTIYFTAPIISEFYRDPQLILIFRVLSVILFFGAINSIQNAYIARNMMFRKLFISSLWAMLISGTVGIGTAYIGWGVWALVAHQITNHFFITIILWGSVKWRPKLLFSFERVKALFSFGGKLLASSLLNALFMDLRTLIIGRAYSSEMLGFYNRGKQFPQIIVETINGPIQSVMLPTLSSYQDNLVRVKEIMRRAIMTSSFVIFPMIIGLAVVAEPLVSIVLTDKWLPAVPFLQIYCLAYVSKPIFTVNLQVINALGRSDIFLKLETTSTIIGIITLLISIPFGVLAIAWGAYISSVVSIYIYMNPNRKLINYGFFEQSKDIIPSLLNSLIMGIVVYSLNFLQLRPIQILTLQISVGAVLYITLAKIFKLSSLTYIISTLKELKVLR